MAVDQGGCRQSFNGVEVKGSGKGVQQRHGKKQRGQSFMEMRINGWTLEKSAMQKCNWQHCQSRLLSRGTNWMK